jgi:hypothetical protein
MHAPLRRNCNLSGKNTAMIFPMLSRKEPSCLDQQKKIRSIHQPESEVNPVVLFFYETQCHFLLCWELVFKVCNLKIYPTRNSKLRVNFPVCG